MIVLAGILHASDGNPNEEARHGISNDFLSLFLCMKERQERRTSPPQKKQCPDVQQTSGHSFFHSKAKPPVLRLGRLKKLKDGTDLLIHGQCVRNPMDPDPSSFHATEPGHLAFGELMDRDLQLRRHLIHA